MSSFLRTFNNNLQYKIVVFWRSFLLQATNKKKKRVKSFVKHKYIYIIWSYYTIIYYYCIYFIPPLLILTLFHTQTHLLSF